jgi:hypothetical protein
LKQNYEALLAKGTKIILLQGDIMNFDKLDLPKADVIWTSNMLYEIEGDISNVIKTIRGHLNDGGIWINADYRYDDRAFATKENPYVAMVRIKEKWNTLFEVLEAPSDSVSIIKVGKDFSAFKSAFG